MIKSNIIQKMHGLLNLDFRTIKRYLFSTVFIIGLITVIGFTITSQARNNNTNDDDSYYNNFQSTIDASMGQDPNLTNNYNNPALSTSMFNINGPIQISTNWSDIYGLTLNAHYANMLSDTNAIAVEGDWGTLENRINVTLGHVFSPKNRIKITGERLSQKQTFDFYSGSVDEWVSQYAGGAELQHLIGSGFFNNVSAGGYYAHSGSKSLDPILYNDNDTNFINYRHIAGANSTGGHISFGLRPWQTGMVTLTSYYDSVHYNTLYSDVSAEDSTSFGYGVALEQYISTTLKTTAEYSHRALYDTVQGGIQFFHNIRHNTAAIGMSLGYAHNNYNDSNDINDDSSSENTYTLGLQYYFMPIKSDYTMPQFNLQSLTAWTSEPAVRMEKVMAAADQKKVGMSLQWSNPNLFHGNGANNNQEIITWSNSASSNIPNDTITYRLIVKEKNSGKVMYENPVTGTSVTVSNLTPGVTYTSQMTATSAISHQSVKSKWDPFTTDGSPLKYEYTPLINQTGAAETAVTLSWKAPERHDDHSKVIYTLTLTNQDTSAHDTSHVYTTPNISAGPDDAPITFTTDPNDGGALLAGYKYKITMSVDDGSNDKIIVTNNGNSNINYCSTDGTKKTMSWDGNSALTIKKISQAGSGLNTKYTYEFTWNPAVLTPAKPGEDIRYHYTISTQYLDKNNSAAGGNTYWGDIDQKSSSPSNSNRVSFQKTFDYFISEDADGYSHLDHITIDVQAKDNGSAGYNPTSTIRQGVPVSKPS